MNILLFQLDGTIPNLALMRLAAHHRAKGDAVEFREASEPKAVDRRFFDAPDVVYASAIFEKTRPVVDRLRSAYPAAIVGGTGVDLETTLESIGVATKRCDYSIYPGYRHSMGFTQRGCRLACSFCKVRAKEGGVKAEGTIWEIWRGEPWPREALLLDNDFFGEPDWPERIEEIRDGGFKVSFNQGINVRMIGDEEAAALASVPFYDDQFRKRRLYCAWDNRKDEARLFRGLELLVKHGVKPHQIMVYVLVGYDHRTRSAVPTLTADDFHRHRRLREFGAWPYPMPYVRTRQLVGFQRWIVGGAYDKRVAWEDWERAGYEPRNLGIRDDGEPSLF